MLLNIFSFYQINFPQMDTLGKLKIVLTCCILKLSRANYNLSTIKKFYKVLNLKYLPHFLSCQDRALDKGCTFFLLYCLRYNILLQRTIL